MPRKTKETEGSETDASDLFNDFSEYWHFARYMQDHQRDAILQSLPQKQKRKILNSCKNGGWTDLIARDELNFFLDEFKDRFKIDLIEIRCKVLRGKSYYMPLSLWDEINERLLDNSYSESHKYFIIGGIKGVRCKTNEDVVLLVREDNKTEE